MRPRHLSIQFVFILPAILLWVGGAALGDVLELSNGGRVEGRLVEPAGGDKSAYVIETAGGRLTIARSQVSRVDSTTEADAEYQKLATASPDTVEGHWKLAEWCREHKLRDLSQQHLARILEIDPNHAEARGLLGFRKKDGQWMTRDDVMAARGLVLYEGRYVTKQHVELLQRKKQTEVSQADWKNNLERLRRGLTGRRQDRADQARNEILAIKDPTAAPAIVAMLRREDDPQLKHLWLEVAVGLNSPVVVEALVDLSLNDPSDEFRYQCLDYLVKSGRPGLATPYIRALTNRDNEVINRAAAALGQIGDTSAIGPLIDVLVTKHKFQVGSGNSEQQAYTFSPDGGGFSFGGSAPQIVTKTVRNPAALAALVSLAGGQSFDYDQEQWRSWLAAQGKLHAIDVRRDQ